MSIMATADTQQTTRLSALPADPAISRVYLGAGELTLFYLFVHMYVLAHLEAEKVQANVADISVRFFRIL